MPGRPKPGTSGIWNHASSEQIVMSGSRPHVVPPPMQYPCTWAIVGLGNSQSFSTGHRKSWAAPRQVVPLASRSAMNDGYWPDGSWPEQKPFPLALRMTTLMS